MLSEESTLHPFKAIDQVIEGDARSMEEVPDNSVALVVTSPPYFVGKEYEAAAGQGLVPATYFQYLKMLEEVFEECVRKLEPGGRIAVNVANLGRQPYRSLSSDVIAILQNKLRLLLRGEVIWVKAKGSSGSCAWGSFQRPTNPVLRDLTERVVIASKGRFGRALNARERHGRGLPSKASLSRDEFMEATTDVWEIPPESASRVGHPAPFPVALPERLIHLYTYYGDLVLDPFMGSGTTAVAAVRTHRTFVGYDTNSEYVKKARKRIREEQSLLKRQTDGYQVPLFVLTPEPPAPAPDEDFQSRAVREGRAARDIAEDLLRVSGFKDVRRNIKFHQGIEVNFRASDQTGRVWYFDVSGGFTSTRPGLKRTDTLWKALGKAAVLAASEPGARLVLLTTDAPPKGSAGEAALNVVSGPGKPIAAVIRMLAEPDRIRLRDFARGQ
jgi:DNA modification methylase